MTAREDIAAVIKSAIELNVPGVEDVTISEHSGYIYVDMTGGQLFVIKITKHLPR